MNNHQKKLVVRIVIAACFLFFGVVFSYFFEFGKKIEILFFLVAYFIVGFDVILKTLKNIIKLKFLDENFLMFIATIGAFFLGQYFEAGTVFLLYQVGEFFQNFAICSSKNQIESIMSIRPDYANLKIGDRIEKVSPNSIKVGDIILIRPGEKVPIDGVVICGGSFLDSSSITGETDLVSVSPGDRVVSGSINVNGVLEVRVEKKYSESTVKKILDLIENVGEKKSKAENFIKRFAKIYTPVVVFVALLIFLIPVLFFSKELKIWFERFLIFLVIACPCALIISIPVSFFLAISKAAKKGILLKGSIFLEELSKAFVVVFDKTGTLTKGELVIKNIYSDFMEKSEILEIICLAESKVNHPMSKSIRKAYGKEIDFSRIGETKEIFGKGVVSVVDGKKVFVGNSKLMADIGIYGVYSPTGGTVVYLAIEKEYVGCVVFEDELKKNAKNVVMKLKEIGIEKTVILTGDKKTVGEDVAKKLFIDKVFCELLPDEKVYKLENFLDVSLKRTVVFVGDGINDAAALKRADVGVAMGAFGAQAAMEAADIILMEDDLDKLLTAIYISKDVMKIVKENIVFSISFKVIIFILGVFGLTNMWLAIFSDVGVSILAILNSFRALR